MTWMQGNLHEPIPPGGQLEPDPASLAPGLAAATGTAGGALRSWSPYCFDDFPSYHCEPKPPYFLKGDFPACHDLPSWMNLISVSFLWQRGGKNTANVGGNSCGWKQSLCVGLIPPKIMVDSGGLHNLSVSWPVFANQDLRHEPPVEGPFSLWRFSMAMGENRCNWSQRSKRRQQLNWNPTICRTCTCRCLFFVICWITQPLLKKTVQLLIAKHRHFNKDC